MTFLQRFGITSIASIRSNIAHRWRFLLNRMRGGDQPGHTPAKSPVAEDEPIGRYILQGNWLNKADPLNIVVRPNAFLPQPLSSVAVSVYRTYGWSEAEIQAKGAQVADERERNFRAKMAAKGQPYPEGKRTFRHLGRGQILASEIRVVSLDVVPCEPPPQHADIVGWPVPKGVNNKEDEAAQLEFAAKLASKSRYVAAT
jgi:hypothetical protein